jgi:hypothetical protein
MEKSDINNIHQLEEEQPDQEQPEQEQPDQEQHDQEQTEVENPFFTYKTHEPRQTSIVIKYDSTEPSLLAPIRHTFNRELIKYQEPEPLSDSYIDNNIRFDLKKIKDFSCFVSKDLYCSDYLIAHSSNSIIDDIDTEILENRPKTLEELIASRGGTSWGTSWGTSCPTQPPPA